MKKLKLILLIGLSLGLASCLRESIKTNCDKVSSMKFENLQFAEGLDSIIPNNGIITEFNYNFSDSLCILLKELKNIGRPGDASGNGLIKFTFLDDKNNEVGVITLVWLKHQKFYTIGLGGYNNYRHEYFPKFLFYQVWNKYVLHSVVTK